MDDFMKTLLSLSVSGTLLLLLIHGLKPLYKNRFSRRWQYYVWLAAALRFLLPFTADTTIVGNLFETLDIDAMLIDIDAFHKDIADGDTAHEDIATRDTAHEDIATGDTADRDTAHEDTADGYAGHKDAPVEDMPNTVMRKPLNGYTCLFFIWLALALVLLVRKITLYQSFIRSIKAGNTEISDVKILNLLSECKEKLNIRAKAELSRHPLAASPMMTGFLHPCIILPDSTLSGKELSYIFMHELSHYKQKVYFTNG